MTHDDAKAAVGFEPTTGKAQRILSPLRLPIPPRGLDNENLTVFR